VKISHSRRIAQAIVASALTVLCSGCLVAGGGYYDGGEIGVGYYEPPVAVYGGWGPGYQVAPFRGGEHHPERDGGHREGGHAPAYSRPAPAYRPAPASRPIPSIPSRSRSRSGETRSR
jgi:hypothetical protein